jgi:hypothetical protein
MRLYSFSVVDTIPAYLIRDLDVRADVPRVIDSERLRDISIASVFNCTWAATNAVTAGPSSARGDEQM